MEDPVENPPAENPYESPKAHSTKEDSGRPLSKAANAIFAFFAALFGFAIAFCCTCATAGLISFARANDGTLPGERIILGGSALIAFVFAVIVWRWVGKRLDQAEKPTNQHHPIGDER